MLYTLFGLRMRANRPVPGLAGLATTQRGRADVELILGSTLPNKSRPQAQEVFYSDSALTAWKVSRGRYYHLQYADGADFLVNRAGTRVWATWQPSLTIEDAATYLLGPVLGFVLRLRGCIGLHASVVRIDDKAIAFVGWAGAGKSTTAAALAQRGYPVLSDDLAPVVEQAKSYSVLSTYPMLRLWDDSARHLFGSPDALRCLAPNWPKRYLELTGPGYRFEDSMKELGAIYILGARSAEATAPRVEVARGSTVMMHLVANTNAKFFLDPAMGAQELRFLERLVARVPVRWLTPHTDLGRLGELCDTIVADVRHLCRSAT